jgi:hypothetical protein
MNKEKISIEIRRILNKYDPVGLIMDDLNPDEYDPEINKILEALDSNMTENDLAEEIYNIFVEFFDDKIAGNKDIYKKVAKEVLEIFVKK